jgi:hypothetical protein
MFHFRTNYIREYNIEELRDYRTMPMRRGVKSIKEEENKIEDSQGKFFNSKSIKIKQYWALYIYA